MPKSLIQRSSLVLILALGVAACANDKGGDGPDATAPDASADATNTVVDGTVVALPDATFVTDASDAIDATTIDAAQLLDSSASDGTVVALPDAARDAATMIAADSSTPHADASIPSMRAGQCYLDSHCGSGFTCVASVPGGFCQGCSGTCSVSPATECSFGTCHEECSSSSECATGMRCNTSSGICVLKTCSTSGDCGGFAFCDEGFCRRQPCTMGTCPSGTTCRTTSDGSLCVEDFLSFD